MKATTAKLAQVLIRKYNIVIFVFTALAGDT